MMEKNHSQHNIYLHDLKNNLPHQQTTATINKPSSIAWIVFLIVATVLIAVTHLNNKQQIISDKTFVGIHETSTNYNDIFTDGLTIDIGGFASNSVATKGTNADSLAIDKFDATRSGRIPGNIDKSKVRRLAQELDSISKAQQSGPPRERVIVNVPPVLAKPITDGRYYPEDGLNNQQQPEFNWITVKIKKGDSLSKIFNRLGLSHKDAIALASASNMKSLNYLTVGQKLEIKTTLDNELVSLKYKINRIKTIEINKHESGEIVSTIEELEPQIRIRDLTAPIEDNLFNTADNLEIPNRIISKLSGIFRWDIDFARDIKQGDRFSLIYEEQYINNELIVTGDILAAEFIISGKITRAIRHKDENGNSHYYTPEGKSLRKAFMRNPIKFAKVTSGFTQRRYHPVLKKWRAHRGVDYGAPQGTPIMATADGVISHIGRKGAYGKAIVINHGKSYSSLYGHMKGFRKGLKNGGRVQQGQIIGYVGSTGLATGPHLHYEFRIEGKHVDPLAVDLPRSLPIDSEELSEFIAASEKWIRRLDALQGLPIATIETESQPSI